MKPDVRLYLPHDFALGAPVNVNLVGTGHLAFKLLREACGDDRRFFGLGRRIRSER